MDALPPLTHDIVALSSASCELYHMWDAHGVLEPGGGTQAYRTTEPPLARVNVRHVTI